MNTLPQSRISINIPRGLQAVVSQLVGRLKQRGIPPMLADGLGELANTIIDQHPDIPKREITLRDMVKAAVRLRGGAD